jgi:hypothetical protein
MSVQCPSCGGSPCEKIEQPLHIPLLLILLGGFIWGAIYGLSREPRFKCAACEHSFFAHTLVSRVFGVVWYLFIALVLASFGYVIYTFLFPTGDSDSSKGTAPLMSLQCKATIWRQARVWAVKLHARCMRKFWDRHGLILHRAFSGFTQRLVRMPFAAGLKFDGENGVQRERALNCSICPGRRLLRMCS